MSSTSPVFSAASPVSHPPFPQGPPSPATDPSAVADPVPPPRPPSPTNPAELSAKQKLPPILQFSTQWPCTKYDVCNVLADLHEPRLDVSGMVAVADGPKPGETVRPRDCHLSNVSRTFGRRAWG